MNSYNFKEEDGTTTLVTQEEWAWMALYKDNSTLKQYDDTTYEFHQFKEIDLDELDVFVIYNTQNPGDMTKRYEIHMEDGMTPIFFYRTTVFNMKQRNETKVRVAQFGYKENIAGRSVKTILSIFPNGALSIRNTDGRESLG